MKGPEAFDWKQWQHGLHPTLEPHSEAKLAVLQTYVEDYIQILCSDSFGRDAFRINIIDGFAGGGTYAQNKLGSPFVLLKAVKTAEARINEGRRKPIKIDCHFYFIEEDPQAFACLSTNLCKSEFKSELGKTVFLKHGTFQNSVTSILEATKKRFTRGGTRAIFFLDQCGYTDVDPRVLRYISDQLNNKAEFIINYAVAWFLDFINDSAQFRTLFPTLGLGAELTADQLIIAKEKTQGDWRYVIESLLGPAIRNATGSKFFSPFYIEPVGNHRGYWLVHLAPHVRARSAMLDVYWKNANGHRHFGHAGLNMLTFKPDEDQTCYMKGLSFNELTRSIAKNKLMVDFSRVIRDSHADGVPFRQFANTYSNQTIANEKLMAETLEALVLNNEIIIKGPKGKPKRSNIIHSTDIILPASQLMFGVFSQKIL